MRTVSRGIGPVRRDFRFRGSAIGELTTPVRDADDDKPRVHHIFLRPNSGAVSFVHRDKTHYFADTVGVETGEQIVGWLRPKLPRSAASIY